MELYQSIGAPTGIAADDLPIAHDVLLAVAPEPEIRRSMIAEVLTRRLQVAHVAVHRGAAVAVNDHPDEVLIAATSDRCGGRHQRKHREKSGHAVSVARPQLVSGWREPVSRVDSRAALRSTHALRSERVLRQVPVLRRDPRGPALSLPRDAARPGRAGRADLRDDRPVHER